LSIAIAVSKRLTSTSPPTPVSRARRRPIISASIDSRPAEKSTIETPARSGGPSGSPVKVM
jgi:hypothetical protein